MVQLVQTAIIAGGILLGLLGILLALPQSRLRDVIMPILNTFFRDRQRP